MANKSCLVSLFVTFCHFLLVFKTIVLQNQNLINLEFSSSWKKGLRQIEFWVFLVKIIEFIGHSYISHLDSWIICIYLVQIVDLSSFLKYLESCFISRYFLKVSWLLLEQNIFIRTLILAWTSKIDLATSCIFLYM